MVRPMPALAHLPDTKQFPIRHVAQVTGVLPVTLRAWERRYGLIKPERTPKGHRLYSEADIQTVHQIVRLIDQGISVGRVRQSLSGTGKKEDTVSDWPEFREQLSRSLSALNVMQALAVLRRVGAIYPLHALLGELIRPALLQLQHSEASGRWAFRSMLMQAVHLYMDQRTAGVEVNTRQRPILISRCLAAGDDLQARVFEAQAREAGLDVRWIGPAPSTLAFADLLQASGAGGGLLWEDAEPVDDWPAQLQQLKHASPVPLAVAGDFSLRHATRLQALAVPVLAQDATAAMQMLRTWK